MKTGTRVTSSFDMEERKKSNLCTKPNAIFYDILKFLEIFLTCFVIKVSCLIKKKTKKNRRKTYPPKPKPEVTLWNVYIDDLMVASFYNDLQIKQFFNDYFRLFKGWSFTV